MERVPIVSLAMARVSSLIDQWDIGAMMAGAMGTAGMAAGKDGMTAGEGQQLQLQGWQWQRQLDPSLVREAVSIKTGR